MGIGQPGQWLAACFTNTVLLEHNHAYLFTYRVGLLLHYNNRVEHLQQRLCEPQD
jgi:hypothetical protein